MFYLFILSGVLCGFDNSGKLESLGSPETSLPTTVCWLHCSEDASGAFTFLSELENKLVLDAGYNPVRR